MEKKAFEEGKTRLFARRMTNTEAGRFVSGLNKNQKEEIDYLMETITGFDILLFQKKYRMEQLKEHIATHQGWTVQSLADLLGVERKTVSAYLRELKEKGVPIVTRLDTALIEKEQKLKKLGELKAEDPFHTRAELKKKLGVSSTTLTRLLRERHTGVKVKKYKKISGKTTSAQKKIKRIEELKRLIHAYPNEGATELMVRLGVSKETYKRYLKELRKERRGE
ncbi:MAG: hypothetical protein DDT31_01530 [Syntrophomonadaceae bacterium]|nr:hypothetical protein [Bacillota bacterium]